MDSPSGILTQGELEPFIGRLIKVQVEGDDHLRVGFMNRLHHGHIHLDDSYETIPLSTVLAVFNIVGTRIAWRR